MDNSDPRREALHEFLQNDLASERPAVLTGWVVVAEWMDDDGEKWLSRAHSASLTEWHANGLHHEALYGDWPIDEEE